MISENMIGLRITSLRQAKNYSRAEFAEFMAVSVQAVGKWERGESLPDIITMKKIAQILECDLNDFFKLDEGVNSNETESENENENKTETENQTKKEKEKITKIKAQKEKQKNFGDDIKDFFINVYDMSLSNWRDGDFSGLKNISDKFKCSNVINCKFCNSDLSNIIFKANNIKGCDFTNANLKEARFLTSSIYNTKLINADLTKSIMKMSNVKDCDLTGANFTASKISSTAFFKNTIKDTNFNFCEFKNTSFENIVFENDLDQASFIGCTFKHTQFQNMKLNDVFFKNCRIKKPKFINCKVTKMTYSFLKNLNCDLTQVEIIENI